MTVLCTVTLSRLFCHVIGESFVSLHYLYRIGRSTVGEIIHETCEAIASTLQEDYMKVNNLIHSSDTVSDQPKQH